MLFNVNNVVGNVDVIGNFLAMNIAYLHSMSPFSSYCRFSIKYALLTECIPVSLYRWINGLKKLLGTVPASLKTLIKRIRVWNEVFSARLDKRTCMKIKFSDKYAGLACVLCKLWQDITLWTKGISVVMRFAVWWRMAAGCALHWGHCLTDYAMT